MKKNYLQFSPTHNRSTLEKTHLIVRKYKHSYRSLNLKVEGHEKNKKVYIGFLIQMYKREMKYKSGWSDLEIVWDSRCKIVFYFLGARFFKMDEGTQQMCTPNFF